MTRGVDWIRKRGDTFPNIDTQLVDNDGAAINLSAAVSVEAVFYRDEETAETITIAATMVQAALGHITVPLSTTITDTAGLYSVEFIITRAGPTTQRVPAQSATDYMYLLVRCDRARPSFPAAPYTPAVTATTPVTTSDDAEEFPVVNMTTPQTFTHTRPMANPDVWFVGTVLGQTTDTPTQIPIAATFPAPNQVTVDPGVLAPLNGTIFID